VQGALVGLFHLFEMPAGAGGREHFGTFEEVNAEASRLEVAAQAGREAARRLVEQQRTLDQSPTPAAPGSGPAPAVTGGGTKTTPPTGGATPPASFGFATPRPRTQPGQSPWHTHTTGSTTDVADVVEIEVPPPLAILGFGAKSGGPCKMVDDAGNEYSPDAQGQYTIPPGTRINRIRCPGKDTREVEFHLQLTQTPTPGTRFPVRATKGGTTDTEETVY
jgi:hypothetical protein